MTVTLGVREVREAIFAGLRAEGETGRQAESLLPSAAIPGRIFHEAFAALVGTDARLNLRGAVEDVEPGREEWEQALTDHAWERLIGPRIQRHQAVLHHLTMEVQLLWDATQQLCGWLAELLWNLRLAGSDCFSLLGWLRAEEPVSIELREPGWREPVRLTGVVDALWRSPETGRWLVIELKTGRTSPAADLAQVALYQMMLESRDGTAGDLALLSFSPEPRELIFSAADLREVRQQLIRLIGARAGVIGQAPPPAAPAPRPSSSHLELGHRLIATFTEYGIDVRLKGDPIVGPTFIRFPLTLGPRVRWRAVERLASEVQVRLGLEALPRINKEAGEVVADLQRPDRQVVTFSSIRRQLVKGDPLTGSAHAPLGVGLDGTLRSIDFSRAEDGHLLVAGTTGSGKSEWLRTAIAGLVLTNTPETLRLLLIDPKRNAFNFLRQSPFLLRPLVFPDEPPVTTVLSELIEEMERRYLILSEHGDDSLAAWSRRTGQRMARIFCICDEYADLISGDRETRRTIEQLVTRLCQKSRAAGIHLILATQQPSREVLRGALDSNIPARVGLRMLKAIESKMLLNYSGAETLLGRGDLLFRDISEPIRLQAPWLSAEETREIFG